MLKRIPTLILAFLFVSILMTGTASAAQAAAIPGQGNGNGGVTGNRRVSQSTPGAGLPAATPAELTQAEIDGLLYMREEEKLAHDVYANLYQMWALPIFKNISNSEQSHFDALGVLIQRYGLEDPAKSQPGVFTNPALQALYNDLLNQGKVSIMEALLVGGAIEEIDILDLQTHLAQTQRSDIQQVYQNLESGSRTTCNAFAGTFMNQTGEEVYASIPEPG